MGHHGNSFLSFGGVAPVGEIGGWIELGRTTLGSANATIDVTGIADKRYLQFLWQADKPSARETRMRLGNGSFDSAGNYADRFSVNGGGDNPQVSQTGMRINNNALNEDDWGIGYISNLAGNEKLTLSWMAETIAGAGNTPSRQEGVHKWANTSVSIDQLQLILNGSGSFGIGSELVILGWDPADTHTSNFWEPLADVDLSAGVDTTIDSGTFTAKKYLWVQAWYKGTAVGSVGNTFMRVGNGTVDTDPNYASRGSTNGVADVTSFSQTAATIFDDAGSDNVGFFINFFVKNNASNEKLIINHGVQGNAAGAASSPVRFESVNKWANTSVQLNRIELIPQAATPILAKESFLKVWGSN